MALHRRLAALRKTKLTRAGPNYEMLPVELAVCMSSTGRVHEHCEIITLLTGGRHSLPEGLLVSDEHYQKTPPRD